MTISTRDIEKMLDYYSKGSDADVLAKSVKSLDKAKARYILANVMNWKEAVSSFYRQLKNLGLSDEEIAELNRYSETYELPEKYRVQMAEGPDKDSAQLMRTWFPKLLNVLRDNGVKSFILAHRKPERDELDKDRSNGRCWTLPYTLKFEFNGNPIEWKIANHSNEGGGSYGVSSSSLGVYQGNQNDLADAAKREFNRLANTIESEYKLYVDKILEGVSLRDVLMPEIKEESVTEETIIEETITDEPVTEGFAIGNYLKFRNDVSGYFIRDQKNDSHLVFEMPMDGLIGKLNPTTTFKLIGYNGDTAKIVAMVNDNMNGNKSGEVYFVERSALNSKAKSVLPRMNKWMNGKYTT